MRPPVLVGALVGLLAGYLAGAYLACTWVLPASNLCGLPGVLVGAPLGAAAGGWIAARRPRPRGGAP